MGAQADGHRFYWRRNLSIIEKVYGLLMIKPVFRAQISKEFDDNGRF
jgi:hypothetical protein